jgi:SAM-dependent methyltransferase
MKSINTAPSDIASIYGGPQGELYSLLMGQQLHVGGMNATIDLAKRADIRPGEHGVDLCCGNGGSMRVLVRFPEVASMIGVDLTPRNVERGQQHCLAEGLSERIRFIVGDACSTGLPSASADFVWGEDAWCYVPRKERLIAEAARVVRSGGRLAFTDWVEGPTEMSSAESERALGLMNFANVQDIPGYVRLLTDSGCEVVLAEDTGRLSSFFDLALQMTEMQFTYDALATVQFRTDVLKIITDNFRFLGDLSREAKMIQARIIARRLDD